MTDISIDDINELNLHNDTLRRDVSVGSVDEWNEHIGTVAVDTKDTKDEDDEKVVPSASLRQDKSSKTVQTTKSVASSSQSPSKIPQPTQPSQPSQSSQPSQPSQPQVVPQKRKKTNHSIWVIDRRTDEERSGKDCILSRAWPPMKRHGEPMYAVDSWSIRGTGAEHEEKQQQQEDRRAEEEHLLLSKEMNQSSSSSSKNITGNSSSNTSTMIGSSNNNNALTSSTVSSSSNDGSECVTTMLSKRDERLLITGSKNGYISMWRLGEGSPPILNHRIQCNSKSNKSNKSKSTKSKTTSTSSSTAIIDTCCCSDRGNTIVACDGGLHVIDSTTGKQIINMSSHHPRSDSPHSDQHFPFSAVSEFGNNTTIIAGTRSGLLTCIDLRTAPIKHQARVVASWSLAPQAQMVHVGDRGVVTNILSGPNSGSGTWIASSSSSGFVTIIDTRTGGILYRWQSHHSLEEDHAATGGLHGSARRGKIDPNDSSTGSRDAGWSSGTKIIGMFHAGENQISTVGAEGSILVWDINNSTPVLVRSTKRNNDTRMNKNNASTNHQSSQAISDVNNQIPSSTNELLFDPDSITDLNTMIGNATTTNTTTNKKNHKNQDPNETMDTLERQREKDNRKDGRRSMDDKDSKSNTFATSTTGVREMARGLTNKAGELGERVRIGITREIERQGERFGVPLVKFPKENSSNGTGSHATNSFNVGKFNYDRDVHPHLFKSWDVITSGTHNGTYNNRKWEEQIAVNDVVGNVCSIAPIRIGGIGVRSSTVNNPGWERAVGVWSPNDTTLTVFGSKRNRIGVSSIDLSTNVSTNGKIKRTNWNELITRSVLITGGRGSGGRTGKLRGKITCMEVLDMRRMVLVGDDRGVVSVVV